VGLTVQGVGYRLEPVSEDVVQAAVRARKGNAAAADSSVKHSMFWEQEAEKTNIAYPHKQPAKAVRLKVGWWVGVHLGVLGTQSSRCGRCGHAAEAIGCGDRHRV
jgi:hypothetical protein